MAKYVKKPVVVDAYQLSYLVPGQVQDGCPAWVIHALVGGEVSWNGVAFNVRSGEAEFSAAPGCWLVNDEKGVLSTCTAEAFAETYDPAPEPAGPGV